MGGISYSVNELGRFVNYVFRAPQIPNNYILWHPLELVGPLPFPTIALLNHLAPSEGEQNGLDGRTRRTTKAAMD